MRPPEGSSRPNISVNRLQFTPTSHMRSRYPKHIHAIVPSPTLITLSAGMDLKGPCEPMQSCKVSPWFRHPRCCLYGMQAPCLASRKRVSGYHTQFSTLLYLLALQRLRAHSPSHWSSSLSNGSDVAVEEALQCKVAVRHTWFACKEACPVAM